MACCRQRKNPSDTVNCADQGLSCCLRVTAHAAVKAFIAFMGALPVSLIKKSPAHCRPLNPTCWAQNEAFGCPYKTLSPAELAEQLRSMQLPRGAAEEAVAKARSGHYQLACHAVFEGRHGCPCDTGINHPNQVTALFDPVPCLLRVCVSLKRWPQPLQSLAWRPLSHLCSLR
jgi:hypothetical protein